MNDSTRDARPSLVEDGDAAPAEARALDALMARLRSETEAEDVPPRIHALALELQRVLDARAAAALAERAPREGGQGKTTG